MHPVALRLEPAEEPAHAVPEPVLPVPLALQHPPPLGLGQLPPLDVDGHAAPLGEAQEIVLALAIGLALPGPDGAVGQRPGLVGHHQAVVHPDGAAEAAAGGAGAEGELKEKRFGAGSR